MDDITSLTAVPLDDILRAQQILKEQGIMRTPLVPFNFDVLEKKIYLKLETLQPVRSFKIRGACSAIYQLPRESIQNGVYTTSAGNFAQGLAWAAQKMDVPCRIIVPENAPKTKIEAITRLGASLLKVPYSDWWDTMKSGTFEGMEGTFVHPVCNRDVIAGNGTMGLEIADDLPNVDTVVCPFGGGGNATGIASALKAIKPSAKVIACEVETGAPFAASLAAGTPSSVSNHRPSFVDGMNGKSLFPQMWNLASNLLHGTVVLSTGEICKALRLILERNAVLAEGAGAATVAAAMTDKVPPGNIVCVVSGGNIDTEILKKILQDNVPD